MDFRIKWKDKANGINKHEKWAPISESKVTNMIDRAFPDPEIRLEIWSKFLSFNGRPVETSTYIIERVA